MSNTPPGWEWFERALTDAREVYAAAYSVACAEPDPATRALALAAAKSEHERSVALAFSERLDS